MAVPDTTTFTLQNVADEFDLGSNDGLIDCFEEATSADFDPAYSGAKDNLLNFRNYGGVSLTSFLGSVASNTNVCVLTMNITYYHNGSGTNPAVGDTVYTDSGGTTPYQSENMRGNFGSGGSRIILKSDQTPKPGIITDIFACT